MRAGLIAAGALALVASSAPADAFCGFYVGGAGTKMFNNATQVVLVRHGTTTVLSMENNYQGPPSGFALVVPVPVVVREEQVRTLPREVFDKVDTLGAPRLVEYWEQDPCAVEYFDDTVAEQVKLSGAMTTDSDESEDEEDYQVKIEAKFSVGEYDIVVLSAQESTGLDRWLRANRYEIPAGAEPLLRPYVEQGTKFFVAKVDPSKVRFVNGMATLSPLRFHYESTDFALPIRLGLANSNGAQDLIVNILAPNNTRYEVANYPNVTIPTNLVVRDEVRTRFGEFYAALFDHAISKVPDAVVTEYAWDSGGCDPCPGPVLDANDLATLGADVIGASYQNVAYSYTLTRLHARYGKDVKSDLVFRAVSPIVGGRGLPDEKGVLDTATSVDSLNQFQGRYVILHPWTGSVACESPQPGRWGGASQQQIATDLAFQPRGKVQLASLVAQDVPAIGVTASAAAPLPIPIRQPQGCGCAAGSAAGSASGGLLVLALVLRRRRRSRPER